MMRISKSLFFIVVLVFTLCADRNSLAVSPKIQPAAALTGNYLKLLNGKRVAIVANQTSVVDGVHLLDTLLARDVDVVKVFSPEHGFRGNVEAGAKISDTLDPATGIPVVSLYGDHRKPTGSDLKNVDVVVYDIQDVGVRFYTYISTMHLVMEACAAAGIPMVILDRPNPNGYYVDGPVLDTSFRSFVGMDPVPVVYGMTVGEYARMVNGEYWLKDSLQCDLTVIPCKNYTHRKYYTPEIPPSPNLPNLRAIYLYPSLCFFEGTMMSVGRGTDTPFEVYGHPDYPDKLYSFTPVPKPGASLHPKYNGKLCYGVDLRKIPLHFFTDNKMLILDWLIDAYHEMGNKDDFFTPYFNTLAGTDQLKKQIEAGDSKYVIRASWQKDITEFKRIRKKYLLYPDFE